MKHYWKFGILKCGIKVENYFEEEMLNEEAAKLFNDEFLTKDDFIHIDYTSNNEDLENSKKKEKEVDNYIM